MLNSYYQLSLLIIITQHFLIPSILSASGIWNYSGQRSWHDLCKNGLRQSPINIDTKAVKYNNSLIIERKHYEKQFKSYLIINNGQTIKLQLQYFRSKNTKPFITGPGLNDKKYLFDHLHFHWGEGHAKGSEHSLNGQFSPMEMHLVHYNENYGSVTNALKYKDGLAVIGVFIKVQPNNSQLFEPIKNGVDFVHNQHIGQFMSTPNDRAIRLNDFLPEDQKLFYRYDGSLTTPSCAESVTWLVFDQSYPIGKNQFQSFNDLVDHKEIKMTDTYREMQNSDNRVVESSLNLRDKNETNK